MSDDHKADVQAYIDGVLDGSIVTGRLERLAVHRHVKDLEEAGARGFYFDESKAIRAINFSKCCRQFESPFAGLPLCLRLDQKFLVWLMIGWRQTADGFRRFRQVQYEVCRKGGKSTLSAFLCCLFLFFDDPVEHGGQVYVSATKQEQAKIVWNAALKMIKRSPALLKRTKITESKLTIEVVELDSIFRPLAADKTPDGFNPSVIVKDEEHAWREHHRGQSDTLGSGTGTRDQPITLTITTYGSDESTVWIENHDYAVRCLESVITGVIVDDSWLALIFALDYRNEDSQPVPCFECKGDGCPWCNGTHELPIDDPYEERNWRKGNPGIGPGAGHTPRLERIRELANVARQRPDKEPEFFQKNLNIRVAAKNKVILPEAWMAGKGEIEVTGITGHGGLDLGRSHDFSAIAAVFQFRETDDDGQDFVRYEAITKTWTVQNRPRDLQLPMIQRWVDDGHIIASPDEAVDFTDVENSILEWHEAYSLKTWAYDRKFAVQMAQRLDAAGLETFSFGQAHGFYTEAIMELLRCIGKFRIVNGLHVPLFKHDGNPCLAWQAGNLIVDRKPSGEMMPDKSQLVNKIDVMVALLMALSECLYHQEESLDGYYLTNSLAISGDDDE